MTLDEATQTAEQIQGWFPHEDMVTMWQLVNQWVPEGGLVVEVGSWKGRSSYILASICKEKKAKLICIDSFKGLLLGPKHIKWDLYHADNGYYAEGNSGSIKHHIEKNLKEFIKEGVVDIWEGNSTELYKKLADDSADLIFVDGDHDEPVLSQDLENYYKKVKKGGYFCGHDYEKGNNVSVGVDPKFPTVDLYHTIWGVTKT